MNPLKMSILAVPFMALCLNAYADENGSRRDPRRPAPPVSRDDDQMGDGDQESYPEEGYQQGYPQQGGGYQGGGVYQQGYGIDPRSQYYCNTPCGAPPMPYPPAVIVPVRPPVVVAPYPYALVPRPMPYGRPGYGVRPGYGYAPRPMPYGGGRPGFRRMSATDGCELQQGNNGEFAVLSRNGEVIYLDGSVHASENAPAMLSYYEKSNFGLCKQQPLVQDI